MNPIRKYIMIKRAEWQYCKSESKSNCQKISMHKKKRISRPISGAGDFNRKLDLSLATQT